MKRLESLDYLRGYAALTIMLYHYLSWSDYHEFLNYFFGKAGYYGVELFYVLSGFTLAFVYSKLGLRSKSELLNFYFKRVFRIFPLLWLVTFLTIILKKQTPDLNTLIVNLSGLFSIYRITDYIATGAWSIGNELFFYLCFPFLVLIKSKWTKVLVTSLISIPFLLFAFTGGIFESHIQFNWKSFINPLGHLLMFYAGILLFQSRIRLGTKWARMIIFISTLFFVFIPFNHREETVQSGYRIVYSSLVVLLVLASVNLTGYKNKWIHMVSKTLGDTSYSLYLLHPIIWGVVGYLISYFNVEWLKDLIFLRLLFCVLLSFCASLFVYHYFEKKFVRLGKKATRSIL